MADWADCGIQLAVERGSLLIFASRRRLTCSFRQPIEISHIPDSTFSVLTCSVQPRPTASGVFADASATCTMYSKAAHFDVASICIATVVPHLASSGRVTLQQFLLLNTKPNGPHLLAAHNVLAVLQFNPTHFLPVACHVTRLHAAPLHPATC